MRKFIVLSLWILLLMSIGGMSMAYYYGWEGSSPPLPPLLRRVMGEGGFWGACPADVAAATRGVQVPLAISSDLTQRILDVIPAGASDKVLATFLKQQGFKVLPPCEGDPSIQIAEFRQKGGLSPMTAAVYWKINGEEGKIIWIKGFVRYTSL